MSVRKRKKKVSILGEEDSDTDEDIVDEVDGPLVDPITMPVFGASPGPTPISTPPPGTVTPTEVHIQHAQVGDISCHSNITSSVA